MEKIALLPGGFKPPHAGHYNMAKWLANNTDANTVIVKVGAKERDGITRDMSLKLWDLYRSTDSDPAANKLSIIPSKHNSPVKDVYDFIEQEAPENSTIYLGMGEKEIKTNDQRFANIGKFADPKGINFETKLVPPQAGGVSGTDMRGFIMDKDQYSFFDYIPEHLTPEQKEQAWQIVTTAETSEWEPGNPVTFEMWTSDWSLKSFGKEYESNFKNREDAVAHYRSDKAEDWAFKSYAYVAKKIPGFGGGLEEDLYNPEDKVNDYMRGSEWKAGMPDGPKDDIPRAYKYKRGGQYNAASGQGGAGTMYENYTEEIPLEIRNTPEEQMRGMMGRDNLEGGMLFPYDEVGERSFHMKNTLIPLDIIFIDQEKVSNIHHNCPPCKEGNCPQYKGMADNVLELPGGYSQQNNINVGDRIQPRKIQEILKLNENNILNELSDREIKFFAMHSDILKQLNTSNFKAKFLELHEELEGERLEALEYFWEEYFSNLDDSCEIEGSFDKKVNEISYWDGKSSKYPGNWDSKPSEKFDNKPFPTVGEAKYGGQYLLSQHMDQIKLDHGPQQYRDLQTLMSQQKDEEVEIWLKSKGYIKETKTFSKNWWKEQLTEILTETKANTHLTHLEELILTQGQDGYNQAKSFLYELIKNLKGQDNSIKNVSVKWDGAPAVWAGINPDNGQFFVGTKSIFNVEPKINYTPQDIDKNHGHAAGLASKLKLALQYLPSIGIKGILQGDFMFDSNDVETENIDDVPHYTFKPNTIRYAVEANSEIGKKIISAKIGIIWHTTYKDLSSESGASFGADISGLNKSTNVWFDDAYFKDDTGVLLSDQEEEFILEKINKADSIKIDYTNLPLKALNTYLNSEIRQGEFVSDPYKSFEKFKNWYQLAVNKSIEKVSRPDTKEKKKTAGELKIKEFESQKENIINIFNVSKLLSQAKSIFITKYDKAVATKHFIDNEDGTLSVTKAEGFVAVDHTENGIKLVDRLEFSKNNFNAGKPGAKK